MEEMTLTQQHLLLGSILLLILLLWIAGKVRKYRRRKERDFTRQLETLLLPEEAVTALCPGHHGRWVLTSKRLIIQAGEKFSAFPFGKIKKVSGVDDAGKAVVAAGKMAVVTVKTVDDEEFSLSRRKGEFETLVKGLKSGVSREKSRQKQKETKDTAKKETGKKETSKKQGKSASKGSPK